VAFCRVTALALLRHLTNPKIMQHAVQTSSAAWDIYEDWLALPEIVFLPDPSTLHQQLRQLSRSINLGPTLWTDAYLAAFAMANRCRLVAFDADFRRFSGLNFLHLTS
jgi:toxin-antitoxin system PIN domain toxin